MNIAIFSEDLKLSKMIYNILLAFQHFQSIIIYTNLTEGFESEKSEKNDMVFIDVREKSGSGVELAARLLEIMPATQIVFIANDGRNAMEGFRLGVLNYLILPIKKADLASVIKKCRNTESSDN